MIVVVGSRHDPVAMRLSTHWPDAALCRAEDLTSPGWVWPLDEAGARTWVIGGRAIADRSVTGVFLRRSAVYPEELRWVHEQDRAYMASEATAMLTFVLATTDARVVNPESDSAFGEDALDAPHWMAAAEMLGVLVRPFRCRSHAGAAKTRGCVWLEWADGEVLGEAPAAWSERVARHARSLGLGWARYGLDARGRLEVVTTRGAPGVEAEAILGRALSAARAR